MLSIEHSLSSLRDAFDRLDDIAERVAREGGEGDVNQSTVDLMRVRAQVKADVIAIRTADQVLGSLFDAFA